MREPQKVKEQSEGMPVKQVFMVSTCGLSSAGIAMDSLQESFQILIIV